MTDDARDLLAEIDATLKLGRERHLDFRERAFNLLVRLRPLVEREAASVNGKELVDESINIMKASGHIQPQFRDEEMIRTGMHLVLWHMDKRGLIHLLEDAP